MKKNIYALLICTSLVSFCKAVNEAKILEMLDQQEHQRDVLALEYALREEKGLKPAPNLTAEQKKELANRAKKLIKKATTIKRKINKKL